MLSGGHRWQWGWVSKALVGVPLRRGNVDNKAGYLPCSARVCCWCILNCPLLAVTGIVHNFLFHDLHSPQCLNKHLGGFENTWTLELSASILEKWTTAVLHMVESHLPGILVFLSLNKEVLCQRFRNTDLLVAFGVCPADPALLSPALRARSIQPHAVFRSSLWRVHTLLPLPRLFPWAPSPGLPRQRVTRCC